MGQQEFVFDETDSDYKDKRIKRLEDICQKMYDAFWDLDIGYLPTKDVEVFNELYLKVFPTRKVD